MTTPPDTPPANSYIYFNHQKDICIARVLNHESQETSVSIDPELLALLHLTHNHQHAQSFQWLRHHALRECQTLHKRNKDKNISNSRAIQRLIIRRAINTLNTIRTLHPEVFQQAIQHHEQHPQASPQDLCHSTDPTQPESQRA